VENEKEIPTKELIEINNKMVAIKLKVVEIQQNIHSHICVVVVPKNPQNPTEKLTKALIYLHC